MYPMEGTAMTEEQQARHALTLAVVCVEQRVDALRAEWRQMSDKAQAAAPGLEEQIASERAALRWLEAERMKAYARWGRPASNPERVQTPDGPGTVTDYGGGAGMTAPYVKVELDSGGHWQGSPRACEPSWVPSV